MSKETLHLMLKLNTEDLDTQVALQCAPLLTGMKISNLLTVGRSKRAAVLELFKETAVSCCILYESSEKTTFLLKGPYGTLWLQGMGFGRDFKPCVHQI